MWKTTGVSFGLLYFKLHMLYPAPLYTFVMMISNYTIFFIISIFVLQMWQILWLVYDLSSLFINGTIFFFSHVLLKIHKTFPYNHFFYRYHAYFLYHQTHISRNWITTRNMFSYFCFQWFFWIILASANFLFKHEICINKKWCFNRF